MYFSSVLSNRIKLNIVIGNRTNVYAVIQNTIVFIIVGTNCHGNNHHN